MKLIKDFALLLLYCSLHLTTADDCTEHGAGWKEADFYENDLQSKTPVEVTVPCNKDPTDPNKNKCVNSGGKCSKMSSSGKEKCCVLTTNVCVGQGIGLMVKNVDMLMSCTDDASCLSPNTVTCNEDSDKKLRHCCEKRAAAATTLSCPAGEPSTAPCKTDNDCGSNKMCFEIFDKTKNSVIPRCCDRMMCPKTGMMAFDMRENVEIHFAKLPNNNDCGPDHEMDTYKSPSSTYTIDLCCRKPVSLLTSKHPSFVNVKDIPSKKCKDESDCDKKTEYCGHVVNPHEKSGIDRDAKFCFKLPKLADNLEISSLQHCKNFNECGSRNDLAQLCATGFTDAYGKPTGICASIVCPNKRISSFLPGIQECVQSESCVDSEFTKSQVAITKSSTDYYPSSCITGGSGTDSKKACCTETLPQDACENQLTPALTKDGSAAVNCKTDADCAPLGMTNVECSKKNICCKGASLKNCPAYEINLNTQKKCQVDADCGKNGMCHKNYCCPNSKDVVNQPLKGPYCTNTLCQASMTYPHPYYCDDDNKMCLLGDKNDHGEANALTQTTCSSNMDCSGKNQKNYCLHNAPNGQNVCMIDPTLKLKKEVNQMWQIILIASAVCVGVFGALTIFSYISYRSRTLVDHQKKKKNKKDKKEKKTKKATSKTTSESSKA